MQTNHLINFTINRSIKLALLFAALYCLAIWATWVITTNIAVKIGLAIMIIISGYYICYLKCFLHTGNSIIKCDLQNDGIWILTNKVGKQYQMHLCNNSVVWRELIILNFRSITNRKKRSIMLCRDSLDRQIWRKLRVLLFSNNF